MQLQKAETNNAIIAKLQNVRKHSNADRLMLATVLGTQVIVGTDAKEGDLVVYFDSNLRLSDAYLKANNLYSNPEMNSDPTKKGYFGKNGKVKAQKLRGELSNGFVASLESLEDLLPNHCIDFSVLTEGVEFTHIDGVEICCKYVVPPNMPSSMINNGRRGRKIKKYVIYNNFHAHWDTKQLMRCSHDIVGGEIFIEEKIHGCVPSQTQIRMADGTKKKIKDVHVGDSVLGYDFGKNKLVPSKVINTYVNGKTDEWYKIFFSRSAYKVVGEKRGNLLCTGNHPVLSRHMKYVPASHLGLGDPIYFDISYLLLTDVQKQVFIGKLLGDGSFNYNNTSQIAFSHGSKQKAYFDFLCKVLGNSLSDTEDVHISGFGSTIYRKNSRNSLSIEELIGQVYSLDNSNRDVLQSVVNVIGPLALAIWYMDDGSLMHSPKQKDRACFAICDYSDQDCIVLAQIFEKFAIHPVFYKSDGYNRIRLNYREAEKLFKLIRVYIPEEMQYKLPFHHRGFYIPIEPQMAIETRKLVETQVTGFHILKFPFHGIGSYKYDIHTETENYIAQGILVHNSSHRTANCLCTIKRKWYQFWKPKIRQEWRIISGTRRVDHIAAHLPLERRQIEEKVGPNLHKGEEIYCEIYGHSLSGGDIQSGFPYGCDMTQYKCMLYRVTITTPDGFVFDLDREAVYRRAAELGLEAPVVLGKSYLTNPITEDHLEHIRSFAEGRSTLDANTLREGVVVWFRQSNNQWSCLKHKSTEFLLLESKQRDDGIGDAEDTL